MQWSRGACLVAYLAMLPLCLIAQDPLQTLSAALVQSGFPVPADLTAVEGNRLVQRSQWDHDSTYFVAAINVPRERNADAPDVHAFRVSRSGKLNRLIVADSLASARWVSIEAPYIFISTKHSPSAGYSLVVDSSFSVIGRLKGYGHRLQQDGTILFDGNMAHFADVHQYTIHAFNPKSRKTTEIFPGPHTSPFGTLIMKRIDALLARAYGDDRDVPLPRTIAAGFDRSIRWRTNPSGRTVVAAVEYRRDRLHPSDFALFDDQGRHVPVDPLDYQVHTIAVCSRAAADSWTCREQELAAVARTHKMSLPTDRTVFFAAAEKLIDIVLAAQ
jgi:hypothetical protein